MIVYVDGFNPYYGLKAKIWQRFYWIDLGAFSTEFLRPGQQLELARQSTA